MSLLEVLTALATSGLLLAGAVQQAHRYRDRLAVDRAQSLVLNSYRRAQSAARAWGRPAELLVSGDSIVIRSMGIADSVELARLPGPRQDGVALAPPSHRAVFSPSGLALGAANVTHSLSRGAVQRAVVVSRLGRVLAR